MTNIFEISRKKIFTHFEAEALLPIIFRLTEQSSIKVRKLVNQIEAYKLRQDPQASALEAEINQIVDVWHNKLEKLGVKPKGLWLADFDNGNGYYCWKFPETNINHCHGYKEGFSGRKKILLDETL